MKPLSYEIPFPKPDEVIAFFGDKWRICKVVNIGVEPGTGAVVTHVPAGEIGSLRITNESFWTEELKLLPESRI